MGTKSAARLLCRAASHQYRERCQPRSALKAAVGACHGPQSSPFRREFQQRSVLSRLLAPHALTKPVLTRSTPFARFASHTCEFSINARHSFRMILLGPAYSSKCQTSTATPAEPGGLFCLARNAEYISPWRHPGSRSSRAQVVPQAIHSDCRPDAASCQCTACEAACDGARRAGEPA
jgi:hypothetical protein